MPDGQQLGPICAATGLNKTTAFRFLFTLIRMGYVAKKEDGRYCLTFKLCYLSDRILDGSGLIDVAKPFISHLCEQVCGTVHLTQRQGGKTVYIYKQDSRNSIFRMASRIGMQRDIYCTASGKSILATMPPGDLTGILERIAFTSYTAFTITDIGRLLRELEAVRQCGYAIDNEESEPHIRCIATAIRNGMSVSDTAISISAPTSQLTDAAVEEYAPLLIETGKKIAGAWLPY